MAPPPAKVSLQIQLPVLDALHCISSSKVQPVLSALHDMPLDLAVVQSRGPPRCLHHPSLVTQQPSKVWHLLFPRGLYMTTFLTGPLDTGRTIGTFSPFQAPQDRDIVFRQALFHPRETARPREALTLKQPVPAEVSNTPSSRTPLPPLHAERPKMTS